MKILKSLRFKVIMRFLIVIFILSALVLLIVPIQSKNFFINEAYRTIEQLQRGDINQSMEFIDIKTVNHIIISEDYIIEVRHDMEISENFQQTIISNAKRQIFNQQRYVFEDKNEQKIYYVIKQTDTGCLVSFVYFTYIDSYVNALFRQLLSVLSVIVIITFLIALYLANSLSEPLINISKKIKKFSDNNWDEAIPVTREDEIGHIERALDEMRINLKNRSKIQQEMFQNISHDLKTPIMIIEGYAQSILDGVIDSDQVHETIASISEEANRLEKKVKSLLYINKIDQLYTDIKTLDEVNCETLLNNIINPFRNTFPNLQFKVMLASNMPLIGEFDEWRVAIENIIDNMTRFAKKEIVITYNNDEITFQNDGEEISEDLIDKLFTPFVVGNNAKFGLGLAITKKIINYFGYEIKVQNIKKGVLFTIYKVLKSAEN